MNALILIDLQFDFFNEGALPVPEAEQVLPVANRVMDHFGLIVASQDWHPANHGSFAANHWWRKPGQVIDLNGLPQVLWPIHCVQETFGASFHSGLDTSRIARVFRKGTDPGIDSYSCFFDNGHRKSTGMGDWLKDQKVTDLYFLGLATDYCVKFSV
ncbi:MAG TPA: bifunctional nicotinamidase/pyrazinamidase, partial [Flavilitoribacter sp.]|nr:bifunctional nicotinamidase/pyrazinamidase [Flavilitoribacter sp.]